MSLYVPAGHLVHGLKRVGLKVPCRQIRPHKDGGTRDKRTDRVRMTLRVMVRG